MSDWTPNATRFAERGHAALTFDHRHFGTSTGEPRQLLDTDRPVEDVRSATDFSRTVPGMDPLRALEIISSSTEANRTPDPASARKRVLGFSR